MSDEDQDKAMKEVEMLRLLSHEFICQYHESFRYAPPVLLSPFLDKDKD